MGKRERREGPMEFSKSWKRRKVGRRREKERQVRQRERGGGRGWSWLGWRFLPPSPVGWIDLLFAFLQAGISKFKQLLEKEEWEFGGENGKGQFHQWNDSANVERGGGGGGGGGGGTTWGKFALKEILSKVLCGG